MRINKRIIAGAIATTIAVSGLSTAANAATWAEKTASYNGSVVVRGSGSFDNSAGTAVSTTKTTDAKSDGNTVHSTTRFLEQTRNASGQLSWTGITTKSTPAIQNKTATQTVKQTYSATGLGQMRGAIKSCAQMGWPVPDACTTEAILTVSY